MRMYIAERSSSGMNMGTYPNRNPMRSKAHTEDCGPNFIYIPPIFLSAKKIDLNPFQKNQTGPNPGFAAIPLRSVGPTYEPITGFESKTTKVNKKKPSTKSLRPKQPKYKNPGANIERKNPNAVFDKLNLDFSRVPPPFCSCTGVSRGCYKWGPGGWQSSCCNISMSKYPLPMSPSRPGVRISGRKMSNGAYEKLLCKLTVEGYDLSHPVDLKDHWAKHGTNKFVTIK